MKKPSVGLGMSGGALLVIVAALIAVPYFHHSPPAAVPPAESTPLPPVAVVTPPVKVSPPVVKTAAVPASFNDDPVIPLPPNVKTVPDEDLLKLSGMVNLAGAVAGDQPPDKAQWKHALPIAEQLDQAPCDCDQRNWLEHFIQTGYHALADENDQFYTSAREMATLRRNVNQTQPLAPRPN